MRSSATSDSVCRDHGSLDEVLSTEMIGICHEILSDVQFQHKQVETLSVREGLTGTCHFSADRRARRLKAM